ncbi:MAG: class I SAM-dependent methyltransferase [Leadbetterella sp.]|nr:class I SAM-dependent methyltransferase [Leadbetterella sp.]
MAQQRTEEWLENYNEEYFDRQFKNPYRSTVLICDWLEKLAILDSSSKQFVIDIATGKGANLVYFNQRFPGCSFLGLDLSKHFVDEGNKYLAKNEIASCRLEQGNLYEINKDKYQRPQGITCLQTISWLPDFEQPLKNFFSLSPEWILLSSLFYEGNVNCKLEIEQYEKSFDSKPRKSFYNIYSIPLVEKFCEENGYRVKFIPFEIDIDIPNTNHGIMGTYTEKLLNGKRLQFSGPLLMNWYFIILQKRSK